MQDHSPGVDPYTVRTPRVINARKLLRRRNRDARREFLAEGPQSVREALRAGAVTELFGTAEALGRHAELAAEAERVSTVDDAALAALCDTVQPQGLVAVCGYVDVSLPASPRLAVMLAGISDPGNAGTILRTADAAGAGAVVFPDDTVDPYNGKCVRSAAGSLFHVPVVRGGDPAELLKTLRSAGTRVLAADAYGDTDLHTLADEGGLAAPTTWLFGSEAHGLPPEMAEAADLRVKIPIFGAAESLNLAAAAAICLYTSARAQQG
ncbi:RNA methyltransferase [Phytomonospora sp. NPDC050363]|uniref:TrmH family RNA methyltransferase n=1 Tax=Phytomonospora sp. NPDC050363 TaxID=3155642 RepID=UPI0033D94B6B